MGIAWPPQLQQFINEDGFNYMAGDTILRSENELGPQKMRRRFTRPINTMNVTITVDSIQYTLFMIFYNTTTNGGIRPFDLANPITGAMSSWRMLDVPKIRSIGGGVFNISMTWEEQP